MKRQVIAFAFFLTLVFLKRRRLSEGIKVDTRILTETPPSNIEGKKEVLSPERGKRHKVKINQIF